MFDRIKLRWEQARCEHSWVLINIQDEVGGRKTKFHIICEECAKTREIVQHGRLSKSQVLQFCEINDIHWARAWIQLVHVIAENMRREIESGQLTPEDAINLPRSLLINCIVRTDDPRATLNEIIQQLMSLEESQTLERLIQKANEGDTYE